MLSKKRLLKVLKNIPDPELGVSIVDMGFVYDVKTNENGKVEVTMTLTSMGCPLFEMIEEPIKKELGKIEGVKEVNVELTFDPPWTPEKMSKEAKIKLGFL